MEWIILMKVTIFRTDYDLHSLQWHCVTVKIGTPNMKPSNRLNFISHFVYMNNVVAHYPLWHHSIVTKLHLMLTYYCDITPQIDQSASSVIVMSQRVMIWLISKHLINMCNQTLLKNLTFHVYESKPNHI